LAIIKAGCPGKSTGKAIDYAAKDREHGGITGGINCSDDPKEAAKEMQAVKELYGKEDGRQYKSYVQSFKGQEASPEKAMEVSKQWAKEHFPGHQVFIGVHRDKENIHCHIIVNSVNYENGQKIQRSGQQLGQMKKRSNEICKEHGLSVPEKTRGRGDISAWDMDKYQTMKKAIENKEPNRLLDISRAIDKAAAVSKDKAEFTRNMKDQGYSVKWEEARKHITFEKDGQKVRAANLEKTFNDRLYSKEGLQAQFEKNRELDRSREQMPALKADLKAKNVTEIEHTVKQAQTPTLPPSPDELREQARARAQAIEQQRAKEAEKSRAAAAELQRQRPTPQLQQQRQREKERTQTKSYDRGR